MDARTLEKKLKFIDDYKKAINASTGSKYDANSNVTTKCIATLQTELGKKDLIDRDEYHKLAKGYNDLISGFPGGVVAGITRQGALDTFGG
jgi:hypothetical protein